MKHLWLIGAGDMSLEYVKVLNGLKLDFKVIGRGKESADKFEKTINYPVIKGGIEKFLTLNPEKVDYAIVSVGVDQLAKVTLQLIEYGVKNILVEKPAGLSKDEIFQVSKMANEKKANVLVAYNRRFFSSVIEAKKIIEQDGGVISFNFEFTEWSHKIHHLTKAEGVMPKWFLANSTHVVDLAFYLGGKPKDISSYTKGSLEWHPSSSVFAGSGISDKGALFSYQANWEAPGRWSVEMLTRKHRLIFCPMEKLQLQEIGSIDVNSVEIDYTLDCDYKPGLFRQVEAFVNNEFSVLCPINEHADNIRFYYRIANY